MQDITDRICLVLDQFWKDSEHNIDLLKVAIFRSDNFPIL